MRAGEALPDLIGIEGEDAVISERDFSWLQGGFVAVMQVERLEAGLIVIGGVPHRSNGACHAGSVSNTVRCEIRHSLVTQPLGFGLVPRFDRGDHGMNVRLFAIARPHDRETLLKRSPFGHLDVHVAGTPTVHG